ncbi:MAG TPA: FtsQ-type POTRA domain-containing protein [Bryobacteraceae bacterium]|nr:FtsQ-type POTRA domain-containing protein [Bryobacteraceae bacterium]
MARRSGAASAQALALPAPKPRAAAIAQSLKQVVSIAMMVIAALGLVWAYVAVDNFLATDTRFRLPGPPEPGQQSEFFRIEGMDNVTDEQVTRIFATDFGRSIYLCPLKARRLKLLGLDWVQEASISRLWPNRLVVRLTERKPVAFAQLKTADGSVHLSLIDSDGVLLERRRANPFHLPVLTGLTRNEGDASRRERMKRFLRMQTELGAYMEKISEIDLSELDNVKVVLRFDHRAIALMLGNQSYRERFENFLNNQDEIRKRLPDALMLDLQLKDRITAVAVPVAAPVTKPEGGSGE